MPAFLEDSMKKMGKGLCTWAGYISGYLSWPAATGQVQVRRREVKNISTGKCAHWEHSRAGARAESWKSLCQQKLQHLIREKWEKRREGTALSLPCLPQAHFKSPFKPHRHPHPHWKNSTTVVEFYYWKSLEGRLHVKLKLVAVGKIPA